MTSRNCKSTMLSLCITILCISSNILSLVSAYHEIKAVPAPLHYILHEASNNQISTETETIQVSSNVPLTVKRYYDDLFIPGQEPIKSNYVNVLITSDCDATTYVPNISFSDDNTKITVDVQGASSSSDNTFLQNSTSYKVEWSAPSDSYHHPQCGTSPPTSRLNEGRDISFKSILFPNDISNIKEVFRRFLGKEEEPTKKIEQVNTELSSDPQCNVNAEILYDSCTHNMKVLSAPKTRVVDGYLNHTQHRQQISDDDEEFENLMYKDGNQYVEKRVKQHPGNVQHRESDDESCVTEFRTHILYVLQPGTLAGSPLVPQVLCNRPKNGGPRYIDNVESGERR